MGREGGGGVGREQGVKREGGMKRVQGVKRQRARAKCVCIVVEGRLCLAVISHRKIWVRTGQEE